MRRIALIGLFLVACQPAVGTPSIPPSTAPTPTAAPTPSAVPSQGPTTAYPERLIADLQAAGVEAKIGEVFPAAPFNAQGFVVCVGTEQVRMYVFPAIGDRVEAAAKISPTDPSNVGTSMVSWNGRPRFWGVDRLLVLYLGEDAPTEALLRNLLGAPFASGEGRVLLPDPACS
jgi:hypothetical protein